MTDLDKKLHSLVVVSFPFHLGLLSINEFIDIIRQIDKVKVAAARRMTGRAGPMCRLLDRRRRKKELAHRKT